MPLRVIFRRAVARGEVAVNPTTGLELPAVEGTARPHRLAGGGGGAARRVARARPRASGRRRCTRASAAASCSRSVGRTSTWPRGVIRVERSWDAKEGVVAPKSRAARRTVPIAGVLREHLVQHTLRSGRRVGLVFGTSAVAAVHAVEHPQAGERGLGARGPRADRPPRVPAHLRLAHDRRRREREGAQHVHGPLVGDDHLRPLRPPDARQRERGGGAARRATSPARRRRRPRRRERAADAGPARPSAGGRRSPSRPTASRSTGSCGATRLRSETSSRRLRSSPTGAAGPSCTEPGSATSSGPSRPSASAGVPSRGSRPSSCAEAEDLRRPHGPNAGTRDGLGETGGAARRARVVELRRRVAYHAVMTFFSLFAGADLIGEFETREDAERALDELIAAEPSAATSSPCSSSTRTASASASRSRAPLPNSAEPLNPGLSERRRFRLLVKPAMHVCLRPLGDVEPRVESKSVDYVALHGDDSPRRSRPASLRRADTAAWSTASRGPEFATVP